jgi:hypothetical protein
VSLVLLRRDCLKFLLLELRRERRGCRLEFGHGSSLLDVEYFEDYWMG